MKLQIQSMLNEVEQSHLISVKKNKQEILKRNTEKKYWKEKKIFLASIF